MYCLTQKIKNKKYILATWTGHKDSCIRLAESVFRFYQLTGDVNWTDRVIQEKMFAGCVENYVRLTDSINDANIIFDIENINRYLKMGKSKTYILKIYPKYKKYFTKEYQHFLIRTT